MYVSRSESHQHDKRRRKKKFRRLLAINLTMLGIIIVVLAVWLAMRDDGKSGLSMNAGDGEQNSSQAQNEADNDAGANGEDAAPPPEDKSGDQGDETGGASADPADSDQQGEGAEPEATNPPEKEPVVSVDDEDTVRLAFVGDILLTESVGRLMSTNGFDYPYEKSLLYLSEPDLTAANLEHPVTDGGVPAQDKTYVFKGEPEALPALKNAGVDVVSLANNHTLDQGVEGLLDTMGHLDDAGISHMGAGSNDTEAFAPVIKEVRGIKIAYIGVSRVVPDVTWKADKNVAGVAETYDTTRAKAAIKKAKEQADIVVVMVHWGVEKADEPLDYQKDFGRQYIDAGADLIIGSHPHVLQGFETYKGKWIAYSLGNFIFSAYPKGKSGDTGVLDAVCTKSGDCELQFYPMSGDMAQPAPMEPDKAKELLARLSELSFQVKLREDGTISSD